MIWLLALLLIANLALFFVNCLMIVIGGIRRERGDKVMFGEVVRQLIGQARERRIERARVVRQADLDEGVAAERQRRARSRR